MNLKPHIKTIPESVPASLKSPCLLLYLLLILLKAMPLIIVSAA